MSAALLPTASAGQTWSHVRGLLAARRGGLVLALVVMLAAALTSLAVPPLLGRVVDVVSQDRGADALTAPLVLLALATVLQGVLTGLALPLVARVGERALSDLREDVLERALQVPLAQVEAGGTGDLVARVGGDTDVVSEAVREGVPELVTAGLAVGLTVVGLAYLDWRLALAGLVVVPVHVLAVRWYARRSADLYAAERRAEGVRAQQLVDTVRGAGTVTALLLGPRHLARVGAASEQAMTTTLRAAVTRNLFFARLNGAELLGTSTILVVGTALVREGEVSLGEATAAALYFLRLFDPINVLLYLLDEVQSAGAALARLVGVARTPAAPVGDAPLPARDGVRLTGVGFAYGDGPAVLHGVDLDVAPGERVAVVGASGAGKSTLALLVAGVHPPTSGEVVLGGVALTALDAASLRRAVGLVTQEVHVFSGPLAEDLRLAAPGAPEDQLEAALDVVGALGWARALPDGLATVVGTGGEQLSAVQAQQVALARVVLADPRVVVLDEATADAGSAGARVLERAAEAALAGRTALVVAHRLSTAAAADRVVVVAGGRVVEVGTPAALVAAGGAYARLWRAWEADR